MAALTSLRILDLVLTSRCNLACSYCYQNAKSRNRLGWDAAREALDMLLASREPEVGINFIGGEPLLEAEMIRKAVEYVSEHRPAGKRIRYSIGTNGMLLTEEHADFLARHHVDTYLSFDGLPAAQRFRGAGTFEKLDALLGRLRDEHPSFFRQRLTVTITVLPSTVSHLPASVSYFLDKGIARIAFSPKSTDTSDWDPARIDEIREAFGKLYETSLSHWEKTGEIPLQAFRQGAQPSGTPTSRPMCGAGRGVNLTVDADGETYGCVAFAKSYQRFPRFLEDRLEPMRLGSLAAAGFEDRLRAYPAAARKAEIFHHKERKYSSYGRCGECRYLASCEICPVSIGKQAGNRDPHRIPDFLCAFSLASNEARERFPAAGGGAFAPDRAHPAMEKISALAARVRQARGG